MKQLFTKFLLLGLIPLATYSYGQTIVNTEPENRKAILEEFTGIYCVYCPEGHAIAEQILTENPGNAFAINIHQGSFAAPSGSAPDFRTQWGNAIANQTGLTGYPAATVNRHVFPEWGMSNGGTGMGRGTWKSAANQIMALPSYLNMAVEATLDIDTRELIVHVEAYYTGDSPQPTNKLNVALLQNNTKGPQTGGGQGNEYNHMRRLVDLLTGQWGDIIENTTQGSFVDKTYTYTIPNDYKNIPVILSDMEIVVFMTETNQEIISGNGTFPSLLGLEFDNDVALIGVGDVPKICENTVAPIIEVQNNGGFNQTSIDFEYTINSGEVHSYTWTGTLGPLHTAKIQLPEVYYTTAETNVIEAQIVSEDENEDNNFISGEFKHAQKAETQTLHLTLNTDNQGAQTRWVIRKSNNFTIQQGNGYGNNETYEIEIELPSDSECYTFRVIDTGGNGGASVLLKDGNGNILSESDGNYGAGYTDEFSFGTLSTVEQSFAATNVYPNPSTGVFNVTSDQKIKTIYVYDVTGKLIQTFNGAGNKSEINLSTFGKGAYILRIQTDQSVSTKKVIVK